MCHYHVRTPHNIMNGPVQDLPSASHIGDGGKVQVRLGLGEPESRPVRPERRKAHRSPVDVSSLRAVWSLLHDHVGVTNVGCWREVLKRAIHDIVGCSHNHYTVHIKKDFVHKNTKSIPGSVYYITYVLWNIWTDILNQCYSPVEELGVPVLYVWLVHFKIVFCDPWNLALIAALSM
jgi:hypothetical protein